MLLPWRLSQTYPTCVCVCVCSSLFTLSWNAILMTVSWWALTESFYSALFHSDIWDPGLSNHFFFSPVDLDHFKVHTRSAVSVREGQGVVLLCGTPTSSGGESLACLTLKFQYGVFIVASIGWLTHVLTHLLFIPTYPPDLTYAWVFNEYPYFVQQDNRRFVSQQTGNLYIAKVEASDVGNYTCVVMNSVTKGKVHSSPTSLILRTDGKTSLTAVMWQMCLSALYSGPLLSRWLQSSYKHALCPVVLHFGWVTKC